MSKVEGGFAVSAKGKRSDGSVNLGGKDLLQIFISLCMDAHLCTRTTRGRNFLTETFDV